MSNKMRPTNHPNRSVAGPKGPAANPEPDRIREMRTGAELTQSEAASLVFSTLRSWQMWEAGDRRMPPSTWELFLLKSGCHPTLRIEPK